jgi:hypothetical protein
MAAATESWVDDLLTKTPATTTYVLDKTLEEITTNLVRVLDRFALEPERKEYFLTKLSGFYHIDYLFQLNLGKIYKWLPKRGHKLMDGVLVDVRFQDKGTYLLFKCQQRFYLVFFENAVFFQRLTENDKIRLLAAAGGFSR